ncbi:hypothetical protein [Actinoplanes sp. NPDC051851]|uniref:hypothetical protein n=1 Tax=Actinoplanes sp. NPDC051851 TaxID=3154753 RepID=UPI0034221AD2
MGINVIPMRPSMSPSAVCAPSVLLPAITVAPEGPAVLMVGGLTPAPLASVQREHQVLTQTQAELGTWAVERVLAGGSIGSTGTTGFKGSNVASRKRYTDGGSGVPPRGRPV